MKQLHRLFFLSFFLLMTFVSLSQKKDENISTKSANVFMLDKEFVFNSTSHKIWMYLPPDYKSSNKKYPVIYMHDAQNLFDNATSYAGEWAVDEILNALYKKTGNSFIVVGIENGGEKRIEEYTPYPNKKYGGGKGQIYLNFLVRDLKPFIDANYSTKKKAKHTAIIGSSLGGLVSFYGGFKYPEVFGKIGALSPSFWFSDKIIDFAKEKGSLQNTKLYFLVGDKEGSSMLADTKKMEKLLLELGFPKQNIQTKIVAEGKHNEAFWKSEFLEVIQFLYNL